MVMKHLPADWADNYRYTVGESILGTSFGDLVVTAVYSDVMVATVVKPALVALYNKDGMFDREVIRAPMDTNIRYDLPTYGLASMYTTENN